MNFTRYAVYYLPPADAPWAQWATRWLGWDCITGQLVAQPDIDALPQPPDLLTATPRKYGLHATIKPPMRLATGRSADDLTQALATLCGRTAPVTMDGLKIQKMGRFLALRPVGDVTALNTLAATCVTELDPFRGPQTEGELAKRRAGGLTPTQEANLVQFGYPYVRDEFRFHITLSGRLAAEHLTSVENALQDHLGAMLPKPFEITDLALAGEGPEGRFHLIHRYTLTG